MSAWDTYLRYNNIVQTIVVSDKKLMQKVE